MAGATTLDTPVLVIGAGPTGLAATIGLAVAGVPSMTIERHAGTSIHPKARGVNVRTMEILRHWGLHQAVREAGLSSQSNGFFFRGPTLLGEGFERSGGGGLAATANELSPEAWLVIAQDALEPVLRHAAEASAGTDIRFSQELVTLQPGPDQVVARVRDRTSGDETVIHARWVIGADGADSLVRRVAGVGLEGEGPLVDNVSILFEAPLGPFVRDRLSAVYYLTQDADERPRGYPMSVGNPPDAGVALAIDNDERWLLVVGEDRERIDEAEAALRVRRALGRDDLPVRILGLMPWAPAARVAERYRSGRLFLVGDAAHQMTPSGAFGLNVGIADAHDLAWKLGAVERGWAGPALLDTYDHERRPVGRFATDQSHEQFLGTRGARPFGNWGVILGASYASEAVHPDGTSATPVADPATDYVPEARPGARAPHAWLTTPEGRISTIDLFGRDYQLLAGTDASSWCDASGAAAATLGVPLRVVRVGRDVRPEDGVAFEILYGIGTEGAVLVRPDGYVAWRRSTAPTETEEMTSVLAHLVGRGEDRTMD